MPNAKRFLDKSVSLTAIQDVELMKLGLLKNLKEFIRDGHLSCLS